MANTSRIIMFLSVHKAFTTFPWLPTPLPNHSAGNFVTSGICVLSGLAFICLSQFDMYRFSTFNASIYLQLQYICSKIIKQINNK